MEKKEMKSFIHKRKKNVEKAWLRMNKFTEQNVY